uniref:Kinesin-like protein KIF13A n=1 Tax=Phallusia mammillata TaxID=59560 RepID=A0A6F9DGF6_9ASCI|nr:kinesin-like protein KIF13A [Phallusia mammillata]
MTKTSSNSSKVKVAVRVRPFNKRELELNTQCVVEMKDDQTVLSAPTATGKQNDKKQTKTFAFDHCFWSMDPNQTEKFANQEQVFDNLGIELLDNAFSGYNACIFAYGQTGSGKSYTMMGSHDQPGLIPRLCVALFQRIQTETKESQSFKVEVSFMEIYNEKVRDLLDPNGGTQHALKVREHKILGPYVDGLQQLLASSAEDVQELMSEGSKSRTVAATKMNAESSRSHAVFTLIVTHTMTDVQSGVSGERVSKLSLVDLAGSERSSKTGASGARLKEGSNINKSLTTLGLVISALADQAAGKSKNKFVPYRDSTLTWILKDNLGGNSRTTMVATLSPSADNYEETLSTLRYADRAKRIVNKAVVNEDPNAKIIRELREEVEKLQSQLRESESMRAPDLKEKLAESEKLIQEISQTWEDKLRKTEQVHKKRQETLEKMGISLETSGIKVEKTKCFLVNLNADPSLNELLVYYLKNQTLVGQSEETDIQLSGLGIAMKHAEMSVEENDNGTIVTVTPIENARTCVNGRIITSPTRLHHGDRILWGNNHFFRINIPRLARGKPPETSSPIGRDETVTSSGDGETRKATPDLSLNESHISYEFAQQEVLLNQVQAPIQETIMSLEREFQLLQDDGDAPNGGKKNASFVGLEETERKKYELEINTLRQQLLTLSPSASADSLDRSGNGVATLNTEKDLDLSNSSPAAHQRYRNWKSERERTFLASISRLREELVRAQSLTQEANSLAIEMNRETEFNVTLQIPTHNLTPNRKQGALLCEPAVQVIRQGKDCQVWSVEKLANRIVDMRELYQYHTQLNGHEIDPTDDMANQSLTEAGKDDPFNETERSQILIGVANVFLECLLQDAPLEYNVPIINQHGQVAGKLLVNIQRLSGNIPEHMLLGEPGDDESSSDQNGIPEEENTSVDITSDISRTSGSSSSSGVGSSLSADPNVDGSKMVLSSSSVKIMDASNSSLSSMATTPLSVPEIRKPRVKRLVPKITCRVSIVEATGLPPTLSHFVQCQYSVLNIPDVILVPPLLSPDEVSPKRRSYLNIKFNHSEEFTVHVTDDLIDSLTSGTSLAIEVWGHRDRYHSNLLRTPSQQSYVSTASSSASSPPPVRRRSEKRGAGGRRKMRAASILTEKNKSLKERWTEVVKKLRLDVTVQELGDSGDYENVEITHKPEVQCIGTFQLKQGQSRRIQVSVTPERNSGTLPLICDEIAAVYAGSICSRVVNRDRGLDSYQDRDLTDLREEWSKALERRKHHLDKQIKALSSKEDRTELERERESELFDQWVMLTEERNAVFAPAPNSGVPGAPASWVPPPSVEMHVPVIFLDLNSEPVECEDVVRAPAGLDSELPQETPGTFVQLAFVRPPQADYSGQLTAVVSWDSSMHDNVYLNRVTPSGERVYIVVKVHVRLSHPVEMDLVLRKRVCVAVYKQKGFTAAFMRKMQGRPLTSSGIIYEIVSNVPLASSEGDDHEALALLAASGAKVHDDVGDDAIDLSGDDDVNETSHFEKYVMRATSSVDKILSLDRLRQQVALRDASQRDSTLTPSGSSTDLMSIISKRNKGRASSVYSSALTNKRPVESSPSEYKVGSVR